MQHSIVKTINNAGIQKKKNLENERRQKDVWVMFHISGVAILVTASTASYYKERVPFYYFRFQW